MSASARGLNQEAVADFMGYSHATICRLETGRSALHIDMLFKLSTLYGVSPAWLLTGRN